MHFRNKLDRWLNIHGHKNKKILGIIRVQLAKNTCKRFIMVLVDS